MTETSAEVLADSISPDGVRLTTLLITFPRFILAEVNTHRMLSRNSASSRAIPTEKLLHRVSTDPFIPTTFNKRVKGMGVGDQLEINDTIAARNRWLRAADSAVHHASVLNEIGIDKSRVNRLLEPFLWHSAIVSATEWANFYALRCHKAAQPEFRELASLMKMKMNLSVPVDLKHDEWHLPLVDPIDYLMIEDAKLASAGKCAAISYDNHLADEPTSVSVERAKKLMSFGHLSPFEHVARPSKHDGPVRFVGNFRGWVQMRKEIPHEDNFALVTS
jgi:hypothetical protein